MASRRVTDPGGNEWVVRRRWVHRRLRWRGNRGPLDLVDGADMAALGGDLPVVGVILTAIALLLIAIAAVLFVIPALIFIVELLIVVAIVGLGLLGRLLLGRPWTVEAEKRGMQETRRWKIRGWRASGELVQTVADELQASGTTTGGSGLALFDG